MPRQCKGVVGLPRWQKYRFLQFEWYRGKVFSVSKFFFGTVYFFYYIKEVFFYADSKKYG